MQDDAQERGALRDRGACRRAMGLASTQWLQPPRASRRDSPGVEAARELKQFKRRKEGERSEANAGKKKRKEKSGLLMHKIEGRYSAGAGEPPSLTTERMGKGWSSVQESVLRSESPHRAMR